MGLGTLPKDNWETRISEESVLSDWTWLLAYEGFRHGWLSDKKGLMAKPFFKPMVDRKVIFYDHARNIQTSRSFVQKQRQVRKRDNVEIKLLFEAMRGIDITEY
ncbi:hypothetical protein [Aminobacter carboxidus]|uniref:hypothetical protein n=1 Tax=Aminobacter carboxidus TaxID=376165 RepID=UPI001AEF27DC|nr:hypothetical protein [Aminobacter carboxidus]